MSARTIWTLGHSNHDLANFLGLLKSSSIEQVADVRRFPGSKRHLHFNGEALTASLDDLGIGYTHYPDLGGRRGKRSPGSPNDGWRVEAFNAFADHMNTVEFAAALNDLTAGAESRRTAVLCSEALPWRCHRRLIADALIVRGWSVLDIMGSGKIDVHALTPFAQVVDGRLLYPATPTA